MFFGCAGGQTAAPTGSAGDEAITRFSALPEGVSGLEAQWWIVPNTERAIAQAMLAYESSPPGLAPATADEWRRNGIRIVAVPTGELQPLRAQLGIVAPVHEQWLGRATNWMEIATGPRFGAGQTIALQQERLRFGAGQFRLLGRSWVTPRPDEQAGTVRAALRIELAPQHHDQRRRSTAADPLGVRSAEMDPLEAGQVFRSMVARFEADPRYAYLLVPEDPLVNWAEAASEESDGAAPAVEAEPEGEIKGALGVGQVGRGEFAPPDSAALEGVEPARAVTGPPAERVPTFGEAMLLGAPARAGGRGTRAIIVLVPHVSGGFRLLGS